MDDYRLEAKAKTQEGIITLGTIQGYTSKDKTPASLDLILRTLDGAHCHVAGRHLPALSARVFQGHLSGRSGNSDYREPIVEIKLATSPRETPVSQEIFLESLKSYVTYMGSQLLQSRVYLQVEGETYVYQDSDF